MPNGRYQRVPGGLRNVVGKVPGRSSERVVLVGAHYDTKDIPGFVGANDGAAGTAVTLRLAREIEPRTIRPTLLFVFFDGEESPPGATDVFERRPARQQGRGAPVRGHASTGWCCSTSSATRTCRSRASPTRHQAVGEAAARPRSGRARRDTFPAETQGAVLDDHIPFIASGTSPRST